MRSLLYFSYTLKGCREKKLRNNHTTLPHFESEDTNFLSHKSIQQTLPFHIIPDNLNQRHLQFLLIDEDIRS